MTSRKENHEPELPDEEEEEMFEFLEESSSDNEDLLAPAKWAESDSPPVTSSDEDESDDEDDDNVLHPPLSSDGARVSPSPPSSSSTAAQRALTLVSPQEQLSTDQHTLEVPPSSREEEKETTPTSHNQFCPARAPGPVLDPTKTWTVLGLFQLFFSASTINTIIDNTNRNAERQKGKQQTKYNWTPLTIRDFYIFLSVILFSGLVQMPEREDYWSTSPYLYHPFPRDKMSQERFEAILCALHLSNPDDDEENERKKGTPHYDILFRVKPLCTQIVDACKSFFHPDKNLCIHELKVKQFGYKLLFLVDSSKGYIWNFSIHMFKKNKTPNCGLSDSSVKELMDFSALGSGYMLSDHKQPSVKGNRREDALKTIQVSCPGVESYDRLNVHYTVLPDTMTWYEACFYHFMDIAVVNAHVLHKELAKVKADGTKPMTQTEFREQLISEMVKIESEASKKPLTCMPLYYDDDDKEPRYCRLCQEAGLKVTTRVYCRKCQVPLCFTPKKNCMGDWHQ